MFHEPLTPLELGERVVQTPSQIRKFRKIRGTQHLLTTYIKEVLMNSVQQVSANLLCELSRIAAETLETQYFISINFKQVDVP